jgi:hypothetical protein
MGAPESFPLKTKGPRHLVDVGGHYYREGTDRLRINDVTGQEDQKVGLFDSIVIAVKK